MSDAKPMNMGLWEQAKQEVIDESAGGAAAQWSPAKEARAVERYVELGGQYETAAETPGAGDEPITIDAPKTFAEPSLGDPPLPPATARDFMVEVEAEAGL